MASVSASFAFNAYASVLPASSALLLLLLLFTLLCADLFCRASTLAAVLLILCCAFALYVLEGSLSFALHPFCLRIQYHS